MRLKYEDVKEVLKRIGLSVLLVSFWSILTTIFQVLVAIVLAVLVASCIAIAFKGKLTGRIGKKFVEYSNVDVTYAAFGFGLLVSSVRMMTTGMLWVGIATLLAGGFFIGASIGQGVNKIRMSKGRKRIAGTKT